LKQEDHDQLKKPKKMNQKASTLPAFSISKTNQSQMKTGQKLQGREISEISDLTQKRQLW